MLRPSSASPKCSWIHIHLATLQLTHMGKARHQGLPLSGDARRERGAAKGRLIVQILP